MIRLPFLPTVPSPDSRARRVLRHAGILLVAGAAVSPGACDGVLDVQEFRVVGEYNPDLYDPEPEVPRTMNVGRPSEITVWTTGNSCVRGGDTEVVITGRTAVVTPYDIVRVGDFGCYDEGREFQHKVNVAFDDPGTWNVLFRYNTRGGLDREVDGWAVYQVEVLP